VLLLLLSSCAIAAGSYAIPSAIYLLVPAGRAQGGEGSTSKEATARLDAAAKTARITAANDAIAAARAHPDDVRLARRAAAMAREIAATDRDQLVGIGDILALLAQHPCPGLADIAATHVTFGDNAKGGDAYLRAARECGSVEAAIAAVHPLRASERCDEAVAALREAWPRVDARKRGAWLDVLDAVATCSDAVTLRRNLSFVPASVFEDYLSVLAARAERNREYQRRAEADARAQAAEDRARAAASRCESECSASSSSCRTSCGADASCSSYCDSVYHACRAGCGGGF
jgi:hypothetical protein